MLKLNTWLTAVIWLMTISTLPAQSELAGMVQSPRNVRADILFERFTSSKNSLPDNRIRSVFQDSNGFLWVGTMNGLCKYDGYTFKKYQKSKQANSITGNWVNSICEDEKNNLWMGTLEGLNYFDTKSEEFISLDSLLKGKDLSKYKKVTSLLLDESGKLWIGTKNGLASFDPITKHFKAYHNGPFNTEISKIIKSDGDVIWIATAGGVTRYNTKSGQAEYYALKVKPNAYGDRFWSLVEFKKDLYIATAANGLIRLNYRENEGRYNGFDYVKLETNESESLINAQVFDITLYGDNGAWLATDHGLAKVENLNSVAPKLTLYKSNPTNIHSLSDNIVFKVFIDKTNVLWCGTELGLSKLDLKTLPFHFYTFSKDIDQVKSIYTKDGNTIYFGTAKSGFYSYNLITNKTHNFRHRPDYSNLNPNRSVYVDKDIVWVGTLGGVVKLSNKVEVPAAFKGLAVFSFLKDSKGNMWIGTNNGLFNIKKDGSQVTYLPDPKDPNSIGSRFVRYLYEDHAGLIWVGFDNSSINYFEPGTEKFINFSSTDPNKEIFGSTVFTILEYPKNTLWVGSESGLNKITLNRGKKGGIVNYYTKTYFEKDGLPDKSVNGIMVDENGFLWLSTIKGLMRFDIAKEHFQHYLTNINFGNSSYFKLNNHKLLFGASDGFVIFDPQEISTFSAPPEVVLTDLKLFNKVVAINSKTNGESIISQSITETKEITLGYKNNVFTLGFSGLDFSGPENNRYAYKMEGFDEDWIATDADNRSATYTNLNPGTYFFKVKAANSFGNWHTNPVILKVSILPPPWKTWWAIAAYVLAFNLLLFAFIRYIIVQSKQKEKKRIQELEQQQLENLNQMKLSFFTDISHEFRTPLSLIIGPVEYLLSSKMVIGAVKQKLRLVYRNCQKMLFLIDELMTFQKMDQGKLKLTMIETNAVALVKEITGNFTSLALQNKIELKFTSDFDYYGAMIDSVRMEMVINNLLSNAFKFTEAGGLVQVHIIKKENSPHGLAIEVTNTGRGINPKEMKHVFERFFQAESGKTGSGLGLALSKNIAELHHGDITVKSELGVSTTFTLWLPLCEHKVSANTPIESTANEISFVTNSPNAKEPLVTIPLMNKLLDENDLDQPTILLVDDNCEVLEFLEMLFQENYQIIKAENGEVALKIIQKQEPDLIISDVMMPIMDGIELCKKLKSQVATFHIPLILLTAKSTNDDAIKGIELGADDYITKPFRPDYLKIRAEKLIEKQKRLLDKLRTNSIMTSGNMERRPLDDLFLKKVIDCIKTNISNEAFSVEELGNMVGMSRSNLFRKIKAITGQTTIEVICYIRLRHSIDLLLDRKLNVSEIAYEVGFKNPSSFSKSFKKQFGKSPLDYLNDMNNSGMN